MTVETTIRTKKHTFTVREAGLSMYECVLRSTRDPSIPHETAHVTGELKSLQMTHAFIEYSLGLEESFGYKAIRALYSNTILKS